MDKPVPARYSGPEDRERRMRSITELRDWFMEHLSELSAKGQYADARALKAEHLEILEAVDATRLLWMIVEPDPA
ncbi:hypothetical protein KBZ18_07145 [Synechococcus sp. Cruz-9H2]|uniref:hypothetical protein n=1 Tax=unclassified Synechococcus TaxID=2626047 RepID=UPI0020CE0D28|nr:MULTISPECIES: hypothetical protein [unclassified Synechococcus]MCP9819266.1 hypothetical protein [Synechococcus sp. Cruz-9H2]MCP9843060.1 hypothetical protein [Synechococcus sp. Edmonson 11F2]MCP9854804.1 hypothetical protein [Synechococcus sp. Cruz-9C9]MCP9862725.1 hypothetical protein [Synechococcus sp. Cruz-7E5]MCP9870176.1 hypothetical protein [Synechococcus sp. Cruz-7B9]